MPTFTGRLYSPGVFTHRERLLLAQDHGLEVLDVMLTAEQRRQVAGWVNSRQRVRLTGPEPEDTGRHVLILVAQKVEAVP